MKKTARKFDPFEFGFIIIAIVFVITLIHAIFFSEYCECCEYCEYCEYSNHECSLSKEFPDEKERAQEIERLKAERELKEAKREKARQDFIEEFKASLPLNLHKNKNSEKDKDVVAYYNPATKTVIYRVQ